MPDLLLYLLKVNMALVLFYLAYQLVLRKLTFYHLNRLFLVFGIAFSTLYPFVNIPELFSQHQELAVVYTYAVPLWAPSATIPAQAAFDYWLIPVVLFWMGTTVMAARLLVQFASLYSIHAASIASNYNGIGFREVKGLREAFSFWQSIYLNPELHKSEELPCILRHEQIHVKGWHTLDVLLAELSTVLNWFNPGAWLMKKAVKENLEFIADHHVVQAGIDKKEYQYLLLKVVGATQPQIANQFNFPSLKRRIAMMNKKRTSLLHAARYAVLIPLVAIPTVIFAAYREPVKDKHLTVQEKGSLKAAIPDSVVYYIDGVEAPNESYKDLNPEEIHSINVYKGESAKTIFGANVTKGAISIITKKKKDSRQVQEFTKKLEDAAPVKATEIKIKINEADESPALSPAVKEEEAPVKINLPEDVIYYIDGKEDKSGAYKAIEPKDIHRMDMYKGEPAQKIFGTRAAKGVVSIITEKNKGSQQVNEFKDKFTSGAKTPEF